MRLRHCLGVAIFCGAASTLGGQTAQAQAPSSVRFVKLLLSKETTLIKNDTKTLNMRDKQVVQLNNATSSRKIKQLTNSLAKLHRQVLQMTSKLQTFSGQVYRDARNLNPANPALVNMSLAKLVTVQTLSIRAGLGLAPATPTS